MESAAIALKTTLLELLPQLGPAFYSKIKFYDRISDDFYWVLRNRFRSIFLLSLLKYLYLILLYIDTVSKHINIVVVFVLYLLHGENLINWYFFIKKYEEECVGGAHLSSYHHRRHQYCIFRYISQIPYRTYVYTLNANVWTH